MILENLATFLSVHFIVVFKSRLLIVLLCDLLQSDAILGWQAVDRVDGVGPPESRCMPNLLYRGFRVAMDIFWLVF